MSDANTDTPLTATDLRTDKEYVHPGESYTVELTVENRGDEPRSGYFDLAIDGSVIASIKAEAGTPPVAVPPGETVTLTYTGEFARGFNAALGDHTIAVGNLTTSITVLEPGEAAPVTPDEYDAPRGKHAGRLDLTREHVDADRWLDAATVVEGLELTVGDRVETYRLDTEADLMTALSIIFSGRVDESRTVVVDAELADRATRGEPSPAAQAGADAGLFALATVAADGGGYDHRYRVDGVAHDTLTYRYDPQASRYGSIDFYVTDPVTER